MIPVRHLARVFKRTSDAMGFLSVYAMQAYGRRNLTDKTKEFNDGNRVKKIGEQEPYRLVTVFCVCVCVTRV